jgi:hypothetical protein
VFHTGANLTSYMDKEAIAISRSGLHAVHITTVAIIAHVPNHPLCPHRKKSLIEVMWPTPSHVTTVRKGPTGVYAV